MIESTLTVLNLFLSVPVTLLLLGFIIASIRERKLRAVIIFSISFAFNLTVWYLFFFFVHIKIIYWINLIVLPGIVLFAVLSAVKYFPERKYPDLSDIERYDERDHMFSRNNLRYHPDLAEKYYSMHPDKKENDRRLHRKRKLMDKGSRYYDKYLTDLPAAAFKMLERTQDITKGETDDENTPEEPKPSKLTKIVKHIAYYYGAVDAGVTELKDYHFYSHHGRSASRWGEPIKPEKGYAIALITPMDTSMMDEAPSLSVLMESSRQYVETAKIAHIVAHYLRKLGFRSTSHVDGSYSVICPPVARDAGLGEIGRIGIFMHRKYGPSVRISVVTTQAELIEDERKDYHINHFCDSCKKCAQNCPTNSIEKGEMETDRNFPHWSINQERCYGFWKETGTDCAVCIRACPYSKPDTFMHRFVRWYISRNPLNQKIALFLDDLVYGRETKIPGKNPERYIFENMKQI